MMARQDSSEKSGNRVEIGHIILGLIEERKYEQALSLSNTALRSNKKNAGLLELIALCELRLGRWGAAEITFAKALAIEPTRLNLLEGMCEVCGLQGKMDKCRPYGQLCLELKQKKVDNRPHFYIPDGHPPKLSEDKPQNVIAFSLFGKNPRYCETAVLNVEAAKEYFQEWQCRFYVDDTVPPAVLHRLKTAGADIRVVDENVKKGISPLMWRFLALDDPLAKRILFRDADSIFSLREALAVREWLHSNRWFHVMRDYFTHHELILAGMWGACGGVLNQVFETMRKYCLANAAGSLTIDQQFLREMIWPTVRRSVLQHDRYFNLGESRKFPENALDSEDPNFHVGRNFGNGRISGKAPENETKKSVEWVIFDDKGVEVCRYETEIKEGKWECGIPINYLTNIKIGHWRISVDH